VESSTGQPQKHPAAELPRTQAVTLHVNGVAVSLSIRPWTSLLDALREYLDLTGTIAIACPHGDSQDCGRRTKSGNSAESTGLLLTLTVPARLRRAGKEMRIVLEDGSDSAAPDPSLLRLLIRANAIGDRLLADRSLTLEEIAKEEKMVASYATRLFRLTLLAPKFVGAILNGNQPPELTARKLMDDTRLPLDWKEQRRALGFA
jgi:site-specific DNA recombinase